MSTTTAMDDALAMIRTQRDVNVETEAKLSALLSGLRAVIRTQNVALGEHEPRRRGESADSASASAAPSGSKPFGW